MWFYAKVIISALIIATASWLAGRKTWVAGFIVALPLTSMLALAFAHLEHRNPHKSAELAKSILTAVPLSLLFFIPFLVMDRFNIPFWGTYAAGVIALLAGYFIHASLTGG